MAGIYVSIFKLDGSLNRKFMKLLLKLRIYIVI